MKGKLMYRYAVVDGLGNYFNGFARYVLVGSSPSLQWSRSQAVLFETKEDAEAFVVRHVSRNKEMWVAEISHVARELQPV